MHREAVISKVCFLVNLEKTNMKLLHTYTIHISQSVNIPNLLLPPNTPFSLMGFDLRTECSWSQMLSEICCWATMFITAGWNRTAAGVTGSSLFLGPEPTKSSSPINWNITLLRTSLPLVSPKDRNKTRVQNTWIHKYKSIRWWTTYITIWDMMINRLYCGYASTAVSTGII